MSRKRRKRLTDKQLIQIALASSIILFAGLLLFVFKDKVFEEPVPDVEWGEIEDSGDISINPEDETPEHKVETDIDDDGLVYERTDIYPMGMSLMIPQGWKANTSNPDIIYFTTDDPKYTGVEIAVTSSPINLPHPDNLTYNMLYFIRYNLKYHIHGYTFSDKTYSTNVYLLNYLYDNTKEVWVDVSDPEIYREAETVTNAADGNWQKKNKFIGISEPASLNMVSEDGVGVLANPYAKFFYTFNDSNEYFVSVMAPADYKDQVEAIHETISNSIQAIEPIEDTALPAFDRTVKLGNVMFKYPERFSVLANNYQGNMLRFESQNLNYEDFVLGISAFTVDFDQEKFVVTDLDAYTGYKLNLFNCYTLNKAAHLANTYMNEIIFAHEPAETVTIDGKTCEKYYTRLFLQTQGTELYVESQKTFPSNAITFLIEDGQYVHIISLTYGIGNQHIAEKYARALMKTISIND